METAVLQPIHLHGLACFEGAGGIVDGGVVVTDYTLEKTHNQWSMDWLKLEQYKLQTASDLNTSVHHNDTNSESGTERETDSKEYESDSDDDCEMVDVLQCIEQYMLNTVVYLHSVNMCCIKLPLFF